MTPEDERIWDRANVEAGNLPLSWYVEKYGEKKMVDLSKIKVGDEVLLKGTVLQITRNSLWVETGNSCNFWFLKEKIVSFSTPVYEPKAGDVVEYELNRRVSPTFKREVVAVHDGLLWLKSPIDRNHYIREISDLKNLRKVEL